MLRFLTETVINSPAVMITSILLLFVESITTFGIRIVQAKRHGSLPPDHPELPEWMLPLYGVEWLLRIVLLVLNWRFALAYFVVLFALKVLPILETTGSVLTAPFRPGD
jgi:hypothetical protein